MGELTAVGMSSKDTEIEGCSVIGRVKDLSVRRARFGFFTS